MITEISVAAAAAAFIVVAAVLVRTLFSIRQSVQQAAKTLKTADLRLAEASQLSTELLTETIGLTRETRSRLSKLNAFVDSVSELTEGVQQAGRTVRTVSSAVDRSVSEVRQAVHQHQDAIAEAVELTTAGFQLWQRWKAHKEVKRQDSPDE
jgi:uncharacterized protein YoxC